MGWPWRLGEDRRHAGPESKRPWREDYGLTLMMASLIISTSLESARARDHKYIDGKTEE